MLVSISKKIVENCKKLNTTCFCGNKNSNNNGGGEVQNDCDSSIKNKNNIEDMFIKKKKKLKNLSYLLCYLVLIN